MGATFAIDVEPAGFVRFSFSGFFDVETFARFIAARDKAYLRLTCPPNTHVSLIDVSGCPLQAQQMVGMFQQLLMSSEKRSRRMAFVIGGSLARMQVRRILTDRPDVAVFENATEAEAWLRQEDAQAA